MQKCPLKEEVEDFPEELLRWASSPSRDFAIAKMSEELAKLAKMANSADLKVNVNNSHSHMSSPSLPGLLGGKDDLSSLLKDGNEIMNSSDIDIKRNDGFCDDRLMNKDHLINKDGNMFSTGGHNTPENNTKLTDMIVGGGAEENKGLPRGKRKGSGAGGGGDAKLKDNQWNLDLDDAKGNLKMNGENNKMPPGKALVLKRNDQN